MESESRVQRIEVALLHPSANQCCALSAAKCFCNSICQELTSTWQLGRCDPVGEDRPNFVVSGFAAGVAGVILASRTRTAISGSGLMDVLFPAIAAGVVGGTSTQGGWGAIWRTLCGIFFLELIRNGFNLLEVDPYFQSIAQGAIILLAIAADPASRRTA